VNSCPECGASWESGYPLCLDCGTVSPALTVEGPLAVKIGEVPSQLIRDQVVTRLKGWFSALDVIEAEKRLRATETLLLRGVDAASAKRILDALRDLKVEAGLAGDNKGKIRFSHLWNAGLLVSFLSLGAAAIIGGWLALLFVLAALGAPAAGAFLKSQSGGPPLVDRMAYPETDYWLGLASEYGRLIQSLPEQDRNALKSIFRSVFDLRARLRSESLPSAAAGFEHGELEERLKDSLRSALEAGRRIHPGEAASTNEARVELNRLAEALRKTYDWFTTLEMDGVKAPDAIESDLKDITNRIDRIVKEARPSDGNRAFAREKDPA